VRLRRVSSRATAVVATGGVSGWRADGEGARRPGAGPVSGSGAARGRGPVTGRWPAVPGIADAGEPVAAGARCW